MENQNGDEAVQERQEDEWIVDDNGFGYTDDGREIFDDDDDAGDSIKERGNNQPKKVLLDLKKKSKSSDIKSLFKALPTKRKSEQDVKLEDDDILGSIMEDLHKETDLNSYIPKPVVLRKKHKFNHHSPIQSYQHNPFSVKQKTPLASDYVPKAANIPSPSPVHRKSLQPKIVDFDTKIDEEMDNSPVIENCSEETKSEETPDIVDMNSIGMDFDPSADIFNDIEEDLTPTQEENGNPEVAQENIPTITSTFQGSLGNNIDNVIADVHIDGDSLPLTKTTEGKSVFRFFWLDAYEDPYKQPGVVYLFGKVYLEDAKRYLSCCVIVKDIPRRFFVLPRETNLEAKKLQKKYAFSVTDIPDVCEYLEVQYSQFERLYFQSCSWNRFIQLGDFVVGTKIKGPCWIDVHAPLPSSPQVSWCRVEAFTTKISNIVCANDNLPIPPVVLMCLNLTTAVNSKTQQNEIVAVSCLLHQDFFHWIRLPQLHNINLTFCVLTKPSDGIFPYDFKNAITRVMIFWGLIWMFFLHRLVMLKIPNWSRVGRLRRTGMPRLNIAQGVAEKNATCGRLLCDVKISSKELIRCKSYDLEELSKHILNQKYSEIPTECVHTLYTNSRDLFTLLDHGMLRSELILRICCELNVLPLAFCRSLI
ncbi:DNA polymerase alpha catalytic subunit [Caerostris extrusa]|uniref:DNA polymerase alpha catalytic subunit n=1 Tax=Caerostris extrusa TaxID=172846 RepID=A0AAV4TP13_CAEEX|nr:DNA polymerase alpha catalytic subunit [Caerostris extrusa]